MRSQFMHMSRSGLVPHSRPATGVHAVATRHNGVFRLKRVSDASHITHARRARTAAAPATGDGDDSKDDKKKKKKEDEALEQVISSIHAKYGNGSIMKMSDKPEATVETFSSGCLALDAALGSGWPKGRVVEIFGPESSGKTTLALHAIAEVQKAGQRAVLVDAEHAFDPKYSASLGVDVKELLLAQPDCGEAALDIVDELARSFAVSLVVIDSVSALVPRSELEGDVGQQQIGAQARLLSHGLRKLVGSAARSNTTLMFINQIRYKVGVMYGNPETTSGGQAMKFYSSVRVDVRRKDYIEGGSGGDKVKGIKVRAKVVKNKVAPPFREVMFDILFARGIDALGGLVDAAEKAGVLERRGSWYYFGETKLAQGRDKTVEAVRSNPELQKRMEEATRTALTSSPEILMGAVETGEDGEEEEELPPGLEGGEVDGDVPSDV